MLAILRRLIGALELAQDASGHWHTVINDSDSYLETSVSAFVVDGFCRAMARGWIDQSAREVVERAFQALISSVKPDGTLDGVSFETYPSLSPSHYKAMPRGAMVPWGQGPLLSAIRSYSASTVAVEGGH
jgi:unsaturated rhamnogalacturonyl hydrolase